MILLTGGLGYIGSHTAAKLIEDGYEVVIADNLSNSDKSVLERIKKNSGKTPLFYKADVCDYDALDKVFAAHKIDSVIHFAALKDVAKSVEAPLKYYRNNIDGMITLLEVMKKRGVKNIIFSSSATVYGDVNKSPISEDGGLSAKNPYGTTKLMCENILQDVYGAGDDFNITILRYFNPAGASGDLGENSSAEGLFAHINLAAFKKIKELNIYGSDYDTPDGTCIRDYVHVCDVASGHIAALKKMRDGAAGVNIYNLGAGVGISVLEAVKTYERVNGVKVPYKFCAKRSGDVAANFADASKAKRELDFKTGLNIADICRDSFIWAKKNL
jgi:UDP-glucose 4-epimerase